MINNEIEKHEIYKQLGIASYKPFEYRIPKGYTLISTIRGSNGFYACVYKGDFENVIVFRGTEIQDTEDLENDFQMVKQEMPEQAEQALYYYDKIAEHDVFIGKNTVVTGHSLGGSLAAIVSAERGVPAVTFNSYGIKNLLPSGLNYNTDNIINYRTTTDPISLVNIFNFIGKCYNVPTIDNFKNSHSLENMGSLYERKEINYSETGINNFKSQLKDILSNVSNSISDFSNNAMNRILKDLHNLQSEMKENYFVSDKSIQNFIDGIDADINKLDSAIMNYALSKGYGLPEKAKENLKRVKDITNTLLSKYSQKVIKGRVSNKTFVWRAEPNACGVCAELDGTEFDEEWEIPKKPHPNCRCTIEEVYDR